MPISVAAESRTVCIMPRLGDGQTGDGMGPEQREPVRVGGSIQPPRKVHDVRPVYPPMAQSARVQGIVIIEATIGPSGEVADVRVLRSVPLLDEPALDAVRQWRYTPTLIDGVAVPVIVTVTVQFTLQ